MYRVITATAGHKDMKLKQALLKTKRMKGYTKVLFKIILPSSLFFQPSNLLHLCAYLSSAARVSYQV